MANSRRHRALEYSARLAGTVLLAVIAVLSIVAHHDLSVARPAPSNTPRSLATSSPTAAPLHSPALRQQLRVWLADAKPPIDALLIEGDIVVAAAARGDIARTAAACHHTADAVVGAERHLPSPDPALNTALQQAFTDYQAGTQHCISGTRQLDPSEIGQGAGFISQGKTELQQAYAVIAADLSPDHAVWTA